MSLFTASPLSSPSPTVAPNSTAGKSAPHSAPHSSPHSATESLPYGAHVSLETLQALRYAIKTRSHVSSKNSKALLSGGHKSRAVNRGMEFEEVRLYQAGDDIRSIDWRVTARTQTTYSKRYSEERERPIITAIDQRRSLFFGSQACFKSVYSCHLAALINWLTLQAGDRSGGIVVSPQGIQETRAARSHKTVNQWLQQLALANQSLNVNTAANELPLTQFIEHMVHTTPTGAQVYLISDFYDVDDSVEQALFQLARHHNVTLLWVVDPLEIQLPAASQVTISNGQSSTPLSFNHSTRQTFGQAFDQKQSQLTTLSQRLGVRLMKAPTTTPPIDIVNGVFN